MRLIDADEVREVTRSASLVLATAIIDAAPTVDVPQPLTRDGVLAAVKAIEDAGGEAVVEVMHTLLGVWMECWPAKEWSNPDVPRWNVRVRAVEVETEDVPLTQLVGRVIKGCRWKVEVPPIYDTDGGRWVWSSCGGIHRFPDGTLDLATGLVTVVKGEA